MNKFICEDCDEPTTWKYAELTDPWGRPTGGHICQNCAEKRYDRWQEKLMEGT